MRTMKSRTGSKAPITVSDSRTSTGIATLTRKSTASRLMSQGATVGQVAEILQEQDPALSNDAAQKVYYSLLKEWTAAHEKEIPHHRAMQLHGLYQDLVTMYSERVARTLPPGRKRASWSDIARIKREIAKITGVYSPIKLEISEPNEVFNTNMANILGSMSDEDKEALLAEGVAMEETLKLNS